MRRADPAGHGPWLPQPLPSTGVVCALMSDMGGERGGGVRTFDLISASGRGALRGCGIASPLTLTLAYSLSPGTAGNKLFLIIILSPARLNGFYTSIRSRLFHAVTSSPRSSVALDQKAELEFAQVYATPCVCQGRFWALFQNLLECLFYFAFSPPSLSV